jgi:hypothetical protein
MAHRSEIRDYQINIKADTWNIVRDYGGVCRLFLPYRDPGQIKVGAIYAAALGPFLK